MIRTRGRDTVRVTKVKGHAEDSDVQHGRVWLEEQLGNAEADTATDLGRRHQSEVPIDAKRRLLKVRSHRYPIMLLLHRFMIAVAGVTVNHDGRGGTAPDPLVWDQGGRRKVRRTDIRVNVDLASSPGPPGFLGGPWVQIHGCGICGRLPPQLVELEVKRKEAELQSLAAATRVMVQQRAIGSSSWTSALARGDQLRRELKELRGEKRKKRKKRKKKLPKTSSGYGRPCDHQRRVPAVPTVHSFMLPVQFMVKVFDMPVVVLRQVLRSLVQNTRGVSTGAVLGQGDMPVFILSDAFGQTSQKTADSPQLQSIAGRRHFLPFAEQILMVQAFQQTTEVSQLLYASGGRCPRCAVTMRLGCVPLGYAGQVFLAVMDQKDSCSGVYKAGIAGYNALRAVFSSLVRRLMMLGIMAVMVR